MASFKNLEELIKKATSWERQLKDLYDVAELGLRDKESKKAASLLRDKLADKLEVLENVDVNKFGKSQWIKYIPDYQEKDIVPKKAITKDSTPEEIFNQLIRFEERMKDFYERVFEALQTESHKDLLSSLVTFKAEQVNELRRHVKNYKTAR